MGDCGSMFLGFVIGGSSIICQTKTSTLVGLALPFLVLGVPILDTGFTVIRRGILYRRSIFSAEWGHLHQRLLDLGLSQRTAVIIIYAVTAISASIGIFMLTATNAWSLGLLAIGLVFLLAVFGILGAAHIRETIVAIKRNQAISRAKKEEQDRFEDAQLRMRRAVSFNAWWESVCIMAEQMQFQNIELWSHNNGHLAAKYQRKLSKDENRVCETAEFILPLRKNGSEIALEMKVRIRRSGSLEASCRQVTLLGRLMDEFPPPEQQEEAEALDQRVNSTRQSTIKGEAGSSL